MLLQFYVKNVSKSSLLKKIKTRSLLKCVLNRFQDYGHFLMIVLNPAFLYNEKGLNKKLVDIKEPIAMKNTHK